jgi:hypothetical protein
MSTTSTKRSEGLGNGATNVVAFRPRRERVLSIFEGVWIAQHRASRELTTAVTQLNRTFQQLADQKPSLEQAQLLALQRGLEQIQRSVQALSSCSGTHHRS